MSLSHAQAANIIVQAWQRVHGRAPTHNELVYTQAVALLETGYGRLGQFGLLAARGQFNWGALERRRNADGTCPPGTAAGTDLGQVCFFVFPDDVSAATAFIKLLTKGHWPTIPAMKGTAEDVATAMRAPPPYYTGTAHTEAEKISAYANGIKNALKTIGATPKKESGGGSGLPILLILVGLGYAAYHYQLLPKIFNF